jgi:hypothetical protein
MIAGREPFDGLAVPGPILHEAVGGDFLSA